MKKKILNVVLGIVLVLAIASFVFVIYVKFFYNIDDTDKDNVKEIWNSDMKIPSEEEWKKLYN